jgi:hypothetical protein
MLRLANDQLCIDLLDPVADAARLGPRFCAGGYLWQVHDRCSGPLFTGPEWPAPAPSAFNGQGAPESFRHRTLEGRPLTWRGTKGVALGAGELALDSSGQPVLTAPCTWRIEHRAEAIEFTTDHEAAGFAYTLVRRIELRGRDVRSVTRLLNRSPHEPLALEWFAHPFFALTDGMLRALVDRNATLADNPGFALRGGELQQLRRFTSASDGHMERSFRLPAKQPLIAEVPHVAFGALVFETGFAPDAFVLWGNDRTFSLEPYLTLHLAPGATREWQLLYRFGASSGISAPSSSARTSVFR